MGFIRLHGTFRVLEFELLQYMLALGATVLVWYPATDGDYEFGCVATWTDGTKLCSLVLPLPLMCVRTLCDARLGRTSDHEAVDLRVPCF